MNILFSTLCNRSCPYCFAKNEIGPYKTNESFISRKNLKKIINFLKKKSNNDYAGILGGEPTLHPDFINLIKMLLREKFTLNIFSNGIIEKDKVDALKKLSEDGNRWVMILNIHSFNNYNRNELALLSHTIEALHNNITLSFNIYKLNFNADFAIDLIKKYGLHKEIRMGIANPLLGDNNAHVPFRLHKDISQRIVRLAKKCDRSNITLAFDCGFTLCSFTKEQIGTLFFCCAKFRSCCTTIVDVGPDLSIWRCFPLSNIWRRNLLDFKNLEEIHKFYAKKIESFRKIGLSKKCLQCKYLMRGQCGGGCLTHTLKSFGNNLEDKLI